MADLWTGRLSFRRLWVLLSQLPQESRTMTALRDKPHEDLELPALPDEHEEQQFGPWSLDNYQLAALIDAVNHQTYYVARGAGAEKYEAAKPLPKPGVRKAAVSELPAAARAYLEGLRATG